MTAELSTTVAELVARARRDVAEHVSETELTLTSGHDWLRLAYIAAEAIAQLVPPVEPLPPAAAHIRHADADLRGGTRKHEAEAADRPADPTTPHVTDAVTPPATTLISAWNAWHCPTCSSRWFTPAPCCGRAPVPVRIEMHVRVVDSG